MEANEKIRYDEKMMDSYRLERGLGPDEKININDFEMFEGRLRKFSVAVGRYILCEKIYTSQQMIEICFAKQASVLYRSILPNGRRYIMSNFGLEVQDEFHQKVPEGFLIANGAYTLVKENLLKNPTRSFAVGVHGENNAYTARTIEFYKQILEELNELKVSGINELSFSNNSESAYFITHVEEGQTLAKKIIDTRSTSPIISGR